MTYISRDDIIARIPNKYEAIRVLALESRRINEEMRAREESIDRKITSIAVERMLEEGIDYYDARERREQERSEAMLAAAEGILDAPLPETPLAAELEDADEPVGEALAESPTEEAAGEDSEVETTQATDEKMPEAPEATDENEIEKSDDEEE